MSFITESESRGLGQREYRLFTVSCLLFSISLLAFLLHTSFYGMDLSDEGFYLNWIAHANQYKLSVTQFGFIFHPLYRLTGQNIVAMRIINFSMVYLFAFLLFYTFLRTLKEALGKTNVVCFSLALSTVGLLVFNPWLLTPNYNTLNFIAILITSYGIASLIFSGGSKWYWCVLIGIGGALSFMAKPTSAALLAPMVLFQIFLLGASRRNVFVLCAGSAIFMFTLFALLIDGSVIEFVMVRLKGGVFLVDEMGGHAKIFRFDGLDLSSRYVLFALAIAFATIFLSVFASLRSLVFFYAACCALGLAALFLLAYGVLKINLSPSLSLLTWAPFVGVGGLRVFGRGNRQVVLWISLAFILTSYVYAIGTNNNYWQYISAASVFVVFGLLVFAVDRSNALVRLLPVVGFVQVICCVVLGAALQSPYRQNQPLLLQSGRITVGSTSIFVEKETARYVESVRFVLNENSFNAGTPIIDLTGHYPGLLNLVGANPIIHPWILGGYPGSDHFFASGVRNSNCDDLSNAWLLMEIDGPRSISESSLNKMGVNLSQYEYLGRVESIKGGYSRTYQHVFYRPKKSEHVFFKGCKKKGGLGASF